MLDFSLSAGFPASFRPTEVQLQATPGVPFSEQLLALWQQSQPATMPTPEQVVASWGVPHPQPFICPAEPALPAPAGQPVAQAHLLAPSLEVKPAETTLEPIESARIPVFQAAPKPVPQPAAGPVVAPPTRAVASDPMGYQRQPSERPAGVQPSCSSLPVVAQRPTMTPPVATRVGAVETVLEPIATLPVVPKEPPTLVGAGLSAFEPTPPESLTLVAVEHQPSWAPRVLSPEVPTASPNEPAPDVPSEEQPEPEEEPVAHQVDHSWEPELPRLEQEPEQDEGLDPKLAAGLPLSQPSSELEPVTPGPQPTEGRPQNLDAQESTPDHAPAKVPGHVPVERPEPLPQPSPPEASVTQTAPRPAPEQARTNPGPERVVPLPVFACAPRPQPSPVDELVPVYGARPKISPTVAVPQPAPALKPSVAPVPAQPTPRAGVASEPQPTARPQPQLPDSKPRATVPQLPAAAFLTPRVVPIQVQAMPPSSHEPTALAIEPVAPAQPSAGMVPLADPGPVPVFQPALRLQLAAMTPIGKPSGRQAQSLSTSQLPASAFLTPRPFPMEPQPVQPSQPFSPLLLPDQEFSKPEVSRGEVAMSEPGGPTTRVQPVPGNAAPPEPPRQGSPRPQTPAAGPQEQPASQPASQTLPAPTPALLPREAPTVVIPPRAQTDPQPKQPAPVSQDPDRSPAPAAPRPRLVMMEQPATGAAPAPAPNTTEATPSRLPQVFEPALPVKTAPRVVPKEDKPEPAPELELAAASPHRNEGPELPRHTVPVGSVGRFLAREIPQHQHGHIEIELDPDRLGRLRIELRASDDGKKIEGVLHVSADHARDALESQMPELRKALASQGIELRTQVVADPYGPGVAADSKGEGRQPRQQSQPASAGPDLATDETPVASDQARRGLYA
ncbi:MAG: flagellar hook-length control protein FliK [Vulcanimicrobiota bacterium]